MSHLEALFGFAFDGPRLDYTSFARLIDQYASAIEVTPTHSAALRRLANDVWDGALHAEHDFIREHPGLDESEYTADMIMFFCMMESIREAANVIMRGQAAAEESTYIAPESRQLCIDEMLEASKVWPGKLRSIAAEFRKRALPADVPQRQPDPQPPQINSAPSGSEQLPPEILARPVKERVAYVVDRDRIAINGMKALWKAGDKTAIGIGKTRWGQTAMAKLCHCATPTISECQFWKIEIGAYLNPQTHGSAADPAKLQIEGIRDFLNTSAKSRKARRQ